MKGVTYNKSAIVTGEDASDSLPVIDGTASKGESKEYARGDHVHPSDSSKAPKNHASTATSYGLGNSTKYGHLKLSDSTSSTSDVTGGVAATPKAVKAVMDAVEAATGGAVPSDTNPLMDGTASAGSATGYSRGDHVHPTDTSRAPTDHASSSNTYGLGTSSNYGHLKLSDSVSSTSGQTQGVAATPAAVKSVNDRLKSIDDRLTYGDTDLVAGISSLTTGVFYMVYE